MLVMLGMIYVGQNIDLKFLRPLVRIPKRERGLGRRLNQKQQKSRYLKTETFLLQRTTIT